MSDLSLSFLCVPEEHVRLKAPNEIRCHDGILLEFIDRHNLLLHNLSLCQQYASVLKKWSAEVVCQLNQVNWFVLLLLPF